MDETNTAEAVNDETLPPERDDGPPTEAEGQETREEGDEQDSPEDIARARRMGWRPAEELQGKPGAPKTVLSAREYNAKVESDLPILRERNRFLDTTIGKQEAKLTELSDQVKKLLERDTSQSALIEDLHRESVAAAKRAYEAGLKAKRDQLEAAARDGDADGVRQITEEIVDLERNRPAERQPERKTEEKPEPEAKKPEAQQPQISEAAQSWISSNQKIMGDKILNPVAVALHTQNLESGLTEEQSFAKLADQVREEMPHKFENQRRSAPATVASSSPPADKPKKKGFDALPDDAKKTYERLAAHWKTKGKSYTKEDYAKNYWLNLETAQ